MKWLRHKPLFIGVVHLRALPGAARFQGSFDEVLDLALRDAKALEKGGVHALCIENFGDFPFYPDRVPAETIASMTRIVTELAREVTIPFGINCLRNDASAALAIAAATGGFFIRVNVHAGAAVTDQGILEGKAHETLRARERLASAVQIFADVHVKHAQPLGDPDITQSAQDLAYRALADALIVTGKATGKTPELENLKKVKEAVPDRLLLAGSGVDPENAKSIFRYADGAIIGTYFKKDGRVENPVDPKRVAKLCSASS